MGRDRLPLCLLTLAALAGFAHAEGDALTWRIDRGWITASDARGPLLEAGPGRPVQAMVADRPFPGDHVDPEVIEDGDGSLTVRYAAPGGELRDRFEPFPSLGPGAWLRTVSYTNRSEETQDLTGVTMRLNPVRRDGGLSWNPRYFWMGETPSGPAICVSYRGRDDAYHLETDAEGRPVHRVEACWRLGPGETARVGAQAVWLGVAGREAFRAEAQRWFRAIGLHVPQDTPAWVYETILYETNAGGHIDSRFSDVGGFDRLARQADYLADLGVTAVWLQSVFAHKTPPNPVEGGWNLYDPLDFSRVDDILGGPEALRRLIEAFRAAGLRPINELVPHGGHSLQAAALEAWWTHTRNGRPQRNWGGYGMDYSSPEWQGVMRDAAALLARDFGFQGIRVDVADGSGPNWNSPRTRQASYSTLAGSIEMLEAIRDGLREGVEDFVIIPEGFDTVEHFALSAVGYGHGTWMLFGRELPAMKGDPAAMAARLREFFERERGSHPAGARILRTLNNHDTVAESGRVTYRYGAGLARALYGVCLMVEGIPMMYQEEEVGSFDALRALNHARRAVPEFAHGVPDYTSCAFVSQDGAGDGVFLCLRSVGPDHAVGASNLSGRRVRGRIALPAGLAIPDGAVARDAVSGRESTVAGHAIAWELGPYETALIRIGRAPLDLPATRRFTGEAPSVSADPASFAVEADSEGLHLRAGSVRAELDAGGGPWRLVPAKATTRTWEFPAGRMAVRHTATFHEVDVALRDSGDPVELRVFNAAKWHVSGATALLGDWVLRRHFAFPPEVDYAWSREHAWAGVGLYRGVAPTGRLWESILEPLHPDRPAVAFEDPSGTAWVVEVLETNARHMVLTDRTGEGFEGPYGLALCFYARDPDLSPQVSAFGLGQPWTMDRYPEGETEPLRVRLRLRPAPEGAEAALDAERLPLDRGEARFRIEGESFQDLGAWWFPKPGALEWSNLVAPPGRYRIRLELRHSERAADESELDDAYEVRVDGVPVALEWVARDTFRTGNAFFGYALTPPVDAGRMTSLSVRTLRPWCAVRRSLALAGSAGEGAP